MEHTSFKAAQKAIYCKTVAGSRRLRLRGAGHLFQRREAALLHKAPERSADPLRALLVRQGDAALQHHVGSGHRRLSLHQAFHIDQYDAQALQSRCAMQRLPHPLNEVDQLQG